MKVIGNLQQRIGALTVELAATQAELEEARSELSAKSEVKEPAAEA